MFHQVNLADLNCIVLTTSAVRALQPLDRGYLRLFVEGGGRLILVVEPTDPSALQSANELLQHYGVELLAQRGIDCTLRGAGIAPELALTELLVPAPVLVRVTNPTLARYWLAEAPTAEVGYLARGTDGTGDVFAGGPTAWWEMGDALAPEVRRVLQQLLQHVRQPTR